VPAFEAGAAHAGVYPLDDEVASSSAVAPMMTVIVDGSDPEQTGDVLPRRSQSCPAGELSPRSGDVMGLRNHIPASI